MALTMEAVREEWLQDITDIYNYYVKNSTATFHAEPLSVDDLREMLMKPDPHFLSQSWALFWDGALCGYAYFAPYKKREAYRQSSEVTLYLKQGYEAKGIGTSALKVMEAYAKEAGVHTLMAVICGENTGSIRLFTKNGYDKCAHLKEVGKKFDRVLDVVMFQKML